MEYKRIPTFIDGNFKGYYDLKEVTALKNSARVNAEKIQKDSGADHVIYAYYTVRGGKVETARLYSGIKVTDEDFNGRIASIADSVIYAVHSKS